VFSSWSAAKAYQLSEMAYVADSIDPGSPDPWGETYAESLVSSTEDLNLSNGPDWSDILDAGEHAAMSWWIASESFADVAAVHERLLEVMADDETIEDIMSELDSDQDDDDQDD
jgi:hypothetical protein